MLLVSADYSQIELRILADMADIGTLKDAFANDIDIHRVTASQMFGVPVDEVGPDLRRSAKTINYGIVYGIGAFGLAQRLGIPQAQAKAYIDAYFEQYPGIRAYMDKAKAEAREKGYVTTLYGRRCYVPEINVKLPSRRAYAERAAINAPIQGTRRRHHEARHGPHLARRSSASCPRSACCSRSTTSWCSRCRSGRSTDTQALVKRTMERRGRDVRAAGGRGRPRGELGEGALTAACANLDFFPYQT